MQKHIPILTPRSALRKALGFLISLSEKTYCTLASIVVEFSLRGDIKMYIDISKHFKKITLCF